VLLSLPLLVLLILLPLLLLLLAGTGVMLCRLII
jgi:hypothetical protein